MNARESQKLLNEVQLAHSRTCNIIAGLASEAIRLQADNDRLRAAQPFNSRIRAVLDKIEGAQPDPETTFTDWFCKNYPGPSTIIHDPKWHAPKILRAAKYALGTGVAVEVRDGYELQAIGKISGCIEPLSEAITLRTVEDVRREALEEVKRVAEAEYNLDHPRETDDERRGRRAAVRGILVRFGLYDFNTPAPSREKVHFISDSMWSRPVSEKPVEVCGICDIAGCHHIREEMAKETEEHGCRVVPDILRSEPTEPVTGVKPEIIDLVGELGREVYFMMDDSEEGDDGSITITRESHDKITLILDRIDALPYEEPGCILGIGAKLQAALKDSPARTLLAEAASFLDREAQYYISDPGRHGAFKDAAKKIRDIAAREGEP